MKFTITLVVGLLLSKLSFSQFDTYVGSRAQAVVGLTITVSNPIDVNHQWGPLQLKSAWSADFGLSVKWLYSVHRNVYLIAGFAYENLPSSMRWDFPHDNGQTYFPKDYELLARDKSKSTYFWARVFPVGLGARYIVKEKQELFTEFTLRNKIYGDMSLGSRSSYEYNGGHTTYIDAYMVTISPYKYSPDLGISLGYGYRLKSGDFIKFSIDGNLAFIPVLEGDYSFFNLGEGNDSFGYLEYTNNYFGFSLQYALNYKRQGKKKRQAQAGNN